MCFTKQNKKYKGNHCLICATFWTYTHRLPSFSFHDVAARLLCTPRPSPMTYQYESSLSTRTQGYYNQKNKVTDSGQSKIRGRTAPKEKQAICLMMPHSRFQPHLPCSLYTYIHHIDAFLNTSVQTHAHKHTHKYTYNTDRKRQRTKEEEKRRDIQA